MYYVILNIRRGERSNEKKNHRNIIVLLPRYEYMWKSIVANVVRRCHLILAKYRSFKTCVLNEIHVCIFSLLQSHGVCDTRVVQRKIVVFFRGLSFFSYILFLILSFTSFEICVSWTFWISIRGNVIIELNNAVLPNSLSWFKWKGKERKINFSKTIPLMISIRKMHFDSNDFIDSKYIFKIVVLGFVNPLNN